MSIIKVICNTYGVMYDSRWIKALEKNRTEYTDIQWRNEEWRLNEKLIKLIEKKHSEIEWLKNSLNNKNISEEEKLKYQQKLEKLTDWKHEENWNYFQIEKVDTDKPWYFSEYDGAISVQYLDKCNENLNMYTHNYTHSFKLMNMNLKEETN